MFDRLGRLVANQPGSFLAIWAAIGLFLAVVAPPFEQCCQDDDIHFLPARCMSLAGHDLLARAFPDEVFASKIIFAFCRDARPLTAGDMAVVAEAARAVEAGRREHPDLGLGPVSSVSTPVIGSRLLSEDKHCALIVVPVETPFLAVKTANAVQLLENKLTPLVEEYRRKNGPAADDLRFATTGPSAIGRDLNHAVLESLEGTTSATVILVVAILLLVYRSPILALVPLITIGSSVWIALHLLALVAVHSDFQLTTVTRIFVVVVLYGAGTDYCLFLISRYRENLERGCGFTQAIRQSLRQVGWALTASAGTVICGMGMMGFAEFIKIRYTGPAIAVSLIIALTASLTLAPVLLRILGRWAFWPKAVGGDFRPQRYRQPAERQSRFWQWVSGQVARRPMAVWAGSIGLFLPLAWLGYHTQYIYAICEELPSYTESRQGLEMITRHFTPGEVGPLTLLVQSKNDWTQPAGRELIARLSGALAGAPNVAEVRSLTQPLGHPLTQSVKSGASEKGKDGLLAFLPNWTEKLAEPLARRHYLSSLPDGNVARLELIFQQDPFSVDSVRSLDGVQACVASVLKDHGASVTMHALYGVTTITHDLAVVHESDRMLVNSLVLGSIFVILLALVRRPIFAFYLLLTVLFSYYVTIGAIELISLAWLNVRLGEVDWKVPYFLFTILVSVGEDYNIFLLTRVFEEARRHGLRKGTQRALASTGATITSCGMIMAGAFATMTLCTLTTLVQLGMALALGVLLDTFVVRPILVPAFILITCREPAVRNVLPAPVTLPAADPGAVARQRSCA